MNRYSFEQKIDHLEERLFIFTRLSSSIPDLLSKPVRIEEIASLDSDPGPDDQIAWLPIPRSH